jgi:hypothetical protein
MTMPRRAFLALCPVVLLGEQKPPIYELLSRMASYFSDGNAAGVMTAFSKSMPGYATIEANVGALTAQADMLCSIELLDETGGEQARAAEVDWFFEIKSKESNGPTERRQKNVKLTFRKEGKNWKIASVDPLSILDPLRI